MVFVIRTEISIKNKNTNATKSTGKRTNAQNHLNVCGSVGAIFLFGKLLRFRCWKLSSHRLLSFTACDVLRNFQEIGLALKLLT